MKNILYTLLLTIIFLAPQGELLADSDNQHKNFKHKKDKSVKPAHGKYLGVPFATQADIELINQEIEDINAELDALDLVGVSPEQLEAALAPLQAEIDALKSQVNVSPEQLEAALAPLQAEIDALKSQVNVSPEQLEAALAPLQAEINALKSQVNVSPEELAAALVPLQADIDANEGNVTLALDGITEINNHIDALHPTDPPEQDLVFSEFFIQSRTPGFRILADWDQFKRSATGEFSSITIRNSPGDGFGGVSVVCADSAKATEIASALNTYVPTVYIGGIISNTCIDPESRQVNWNVGSCNGEVELNASTDRVVCSSINGAVVRPLQSNSSWGGIGGEFAGRGTVSQTLEVILTR